MSLLQFDADAAVSTLLARGLVDPRFARELLDRRSAASSSETPQLADRVDAERLALFAGFITKVRYNNELFVHLPGTLRLLKVHGVEITAFRDYFLSGASRAKTPREKVLAALSHFERFAASPGGRVVPGLADVVAHERVLWELRSALAEWNDRSTPPAVPSPSGPWRVIETRRDPHAVLDAALSERATCRAARRPIPRLYWAVPFLCEIRSVAIDRRVRLVLDAVDGQRSSADIAVLLRRARIATLTTFAILRSLADAGVVETGAEAP